MRDSKRSDGLYVVRVDSCDYDSGTMIVRDITHNNIGGDPVEVKIPDNLSASTEGFVQSIDRGSVFICASIERYQDGKFIPICPVRNDAFYNIPNISDDYDSRPEGIVFEIPERDNNDNDSYSSAMIGGDSGCVGIKRSGDLVFGNISNNMMIAYRSARAGEWRHEVSSNGSYYKNDAIEAISGKIYRVDREQERNSSQQLSVNDSRNLYSELKFNLSEPVGVYNGSRVSDDNGRKESRNLARSSFEMRINEFAEHSNFKGWDIEHKMHAKKDKNNSVMNHYDSKFKSNPRNNRIGNTLHMTENVIAKVVIGNVVDINGNPLNINHGIALNESKPKNLSNISNAKLEMERLMRKTRRELAFHFAISTNSITTDVPQSKNDFIVNVDKQGVLKLNVPRSNEFGNIPFASNTYYLGTKDDRRVCYLNPSRESRIPVLLRDEDGTPVLPEDPYVSPDISGGIRRRTGVEFYNVSYNNTPKYFPTDLSNLPISSNKNKSEASSEDPDLSFMSGTRARVNMTAFHNMYECAERLIANSIDGFLLSDKKITDSHTTSGKVSYKEPFELLKNQENSKSDAKSKSITRGLVTPGNPAISPGGKVSVCGHNIAKGILNKDTQTYSNIDNASIDKDGVVSSSALGLNPNAFGFETVSSVAGISANLNFQGAVYTSIGKDSHDEKSLVMDTDGSVVSWIGKDKNDRSVVCQTDGDVLFNIGGSYDEETGDSQTPPIMNNGRLEIRVNVCDRGFHDDDPDNAVGEEDGDTKTKKVKVDDFVISISEKGLVISGSGNTPMIFRNNGDIRIEASNNLVLRGQNGINLHSSHSIGKIINSPDKIVGG